MIGQRPEPPDVDYERAQAIWAFRTSELVDALWELCADWDADAQLQLGVAAHQLRDLLAGDDLPPARTTITRAPRIRPATPNRPQPGA